MDGSFPPPWLDNIQKKLQIKPMALFLDFDGTLVPIASRPEQALLTPPVRNGLRQIARQHPTVLISGRALKDIKARVGLRKVTYVGNHGLEISNPKFQYKMKNAGPWRRLLYKVLTECESELESIPGIIVEDKGATLSIHYRLAGKEARKKAEKIFIDRIKPVIAQKKGRITHGKAVWEVRPPVEWNKGKAVLWILKHQGFKGHWPLYIGDDITDQDAFKAIQTIGLGIAVGPPEHKGAAHFRLNSPKEVHHFLAWLQHRSGVSRL